jgi:hypothetical protein
MIPTIEAARKGKSSVTSAMLRWQTVAAMVGRNFERWMDTRPVRTFPQGNSQTLDFQEKREYIRFTNNYSHFERIF